MNKLSVLLLVLLLIAVIIPFYVFAAAPNLMVEYDFDGTLTDTYGHSTLTAFDTANDGNNHNNLTSGFDVDASAAGDQTYWYWTSDLARGGGFYIDVNDINIANNYTIGVRFLYDSITTGGYDKIIDYQNMTSDNGFYFLDGYLLFYPSSGAGPTEYAEGTIIDVIATRNEATDEFIAYTVVNGTIVEEINIIDSSNDAIATTIASAVRFGFFFDDNATSSEATAGGRVYSIKVWDGAISTLAAEDAMDNGSGVVTNPRTSDMYGNIWLYIFYGLGIVIIILSLFLIKVKHIKRAKQN